MPFDWFNYLHEELEPHTTIEQQIIYVSILCFAEICNLIIFLHTIIKLKRNLPSLREVRSYIIAMFGLVIWPIGEIIGTFLYIFTWKYTIFESTENFPFAIGITFAIIFFSNYIQYTLRTKKLIEKRELIAHRLLNLATIFTALPLLYITIRFILIGIMTEDTILITEKITMYIIIVLAIFVYIILFSGSIQLNREYKKLISQLNRARLLLFRIYFIIIFIALITLTIFLLATIFSNLWSTRPLFMLYTAMLIYFYSFPAAVALFLGMFMPVWLQKRMGILPSFQKTEEVP